MKDVKIAAIVGNPDGSQKRKAGTFTVNIHLFRRGEHNYHEGVASTIHRLITEAREYGHMFHPERVPLYLRIEPHGSSDPVSTREVEQIRQFAQGHSRLPVKVFGFHADVMRGLQHLNYRNGRRVTGRRSYLGRPPEGDENPYHQLSFL